MTLEQCDDCLHYMKEYQQWHRCPNCGSTKPKEAYNEWHGRASLYPNHTSSHITIAPGLFRLIIYITILLSVLLILGWSMDTMLPSIQGGI